MFSSYLPANSLFFGQPRARKVRFQFFDFRLFPLLYKDAYSQVLSTLDSTIMYVDTLSLTCICWAVSTLIKNN